MIINFDMLKTFYSAIVNRMKGFRGNWNQNDPTADDYIKGRTHWAEERVLVEEITIEIDEDGGYVENPFSIDLVVGKEYTVIFNGTKYNCTCYADEWDDIFIGNASIWDEEGGNDEPFLISNYGDTTAINTVYSGTYTLTILDENVHKLDEKYLPDMSGFARKDDKINVVWSGINVTGGISSMTYEEILEALGSRPVSDLNIILCWGFSTNSGVYYPSSVNVSFGDNDFAIYVDVFSYTLSHLEIYKFKLAMGEGNMVTVTRDSISLA